MDAGADQTVANGSTVSLTASAADDGAPTIEWSQTSGTTLSLWSATTEKTAFTAAEELVFEISVDDGVNAAVTDSVTITVEPDTVAQQGMDPSLVLSLVEAVITESCTL